MPPTSSRIRRASSSRPRITAIWPARRETSRRRPSAPSSLRLAGLPGERALRRHQGGRRARGRQGRDRCPRPGEGEPGEGRLRDRDRVRRDARHHRRAARTRPLGGLARRRLHARQPGLPLRREPGPRRRPPRKKRALGRGRGGRRRRGNGPQPSRGPTQDCHMNSEPCAACLWCMGLFKCMS